MNNKLIERVIETNIGVCPEIHYKNPVVDRNVSKALAKSFVKILKLSEQNSTVHNNLRISILENIRKMCVLEPENHMVVDENITEALSEIYIKQSQLISKSSVEKDLDAFLMKRFKIMDINPLYEARVNPEIIKALLNLNENGVYLKTFAKDIVHWNTSKGNMLTIIKDLWETHAFCEENSYNGLAIKMKPEIEKRILCTCHQILTNPSLDLQAELSSDNMEPLIKSSSVSSEWFQISISVLNSIYIMTNFNSRLLGFISLFINNVKTLCDKTTFSILYPVHLTHIVVMLDFRISSLPESLKVNYVTSTLKCMCELWEKSEHDFVMLLSHFPQWFDIYFQDSEESSPSY